MLVRLIYVSTAHDSVNNAEFKNILATANRANAQRGLTGMLAFNSRYFLQALEGSREEVNKLYNKLDADPRHHTLAILKFSEITEREWADWSMGFAAPNTENKALFLKYSPSSTFNPYLMTGDAAERILRELAQTAINMAAQKAADTARPILVNTANAATAVPPAQHQPAIPLVEPALPEHRPAANGGGVFSRLFSGK